MTTQACDRCHRRKSRCDKLLPICGQCKKAGTPCNYIDRKKETREVFERLQRLLKQAEATNRSLTAKLAAAQTPSQQLSPLVNSDDAHVVETPLADGINNSRNENDGNDLIDQVSFLSSCAGGERQFLGSASGVLFADLVHATIQATSTSTTGNNNQRTRRGNTGRHFFTTSGPPQSSQSSPSIEVSSLPPERVARDLHRAYFEHDHLSYPFLHRSSTLNALDEAYSDPDFLQRSPFANFVFDMILAIATASVHRFNLETLPDAEGYQMRAVQRLHEVLQGGGIQSLQAILLLCQYRMMSSIQDTSTSLWHIVGIAVRMCFEKGLHREQVYQHFDASRSPEGNASPEVVSSEIWRRCFWSVVAMDRILSITLGRPLAIRMQDTDTTLPDPALDSIVNRHESDTHTTPDFCRTDLFNHIIRYRIICGNILSSLHNGTTPQTQLGQTAALTARDSLAAELTAWHQDTTRLSLPDIDFTRALPGDLSSFCAKEWYEMLYHNARLMLFRPSPALSSMSSTDPTVLQSIFVAAKQSITLYAHLHRSRRINYTWITLHSVFMGGLSYVYAVGRHFRSCKRFLMGSSNDPMLEKSPTIVEIVNDSRACSNVLVAISDRWNSSKNCHDVFNVLSNAVLSDAVDYYTQRGNPDISQMAAATSTTTTAAAAQNEQQQQQQQHMIDLETTVAEDHWDVAAHSNQMDTTPLAVDSVFHECFDELQNFQMQSFDDPIGQLSHTWLGELGGMGLKLPSIWETQ